ncbi:MAG: SDR family NAD(P)-dependent oxidoreductase, partial [Solirubrobacteraceae bacterium]
LTGELGRVCGLVHLASPDARDGGLRPLLLLCQALQGDLAAAAAHGGAAVVGVTRLGGTFGIDTAIDGDALATAAVAGLLKTLALEWPDVRVKAVDLPAHQPAQAATSVAGEHDAAVAALLDEMTASDRLVEVGYREGARVRVALAPRPLIPPAAGEPPERDDPPIGPDSVILITGGARGITADVAVALAARHRPTLVILGRTPEVDEPPTTAALDLGELRSAMIAERRRSGEPLTPSVIEGECRRIMREREVRHNLDRLRAAGARVEYRVCDVQSPASLAAAVGEVYERHGRIDGAIHGAGVIEDRLVVDKGLDSLDRVMATKAGAARTLAAALRAPDLRFLVLFSSVSGRFGNRGQADYAAASEILNKLAQDLDRRWPGRVVAVEWGPWRAGMVSAALEREFTRRGVVLIDTEEGCRRLQEEILRGHKGEPEVVVGAAVGPAGAGEPADPVGAGGRTAGPHHPLLSGPPEPGDGPEPTFRARRTLTLEHDLYLDHHRVDGRPVLPFAAAMEMMAEMAALAAPERRIVGLSGIRLLKGIVVPDGAWSDVCLTADLHDADAADVVIHATDRDRPHYRARVALAPPRPRNDHVEPEPGPGPEPPPAISDFAPFPMPLATAYSELLFHGPLFQRIESIDGMDERGSTAQLSASHAGACVRGGDGLTWLLDPILLDSALQVQVLWARLQWDVTLLPAEIAQHTRDGEVRPLEPVRHEMRIRPDARPPMCRADHWFFGSDGRLIATLSDVVGVGTRALNRLAAGRA